MNDSKKKKNASILSFTPTDLLDGDTYWPDSLVTVMKYEPIMEPYVNFSGGKAMSICHTNA